MVEAANRLRAFGVAGGLVSLAAITTILVYARPGERDVPFENALLVAWWGGGLTGLIVGAFAADTTSGRAALALSIVALPVGWVASGVLHFAGLVD